MCIYMYTHMVCIFMFELILGCDEDRKPPPNSYTCIHMYKFMNTYVFVYLPTLKHTSPWICA